MGNVITKRVVDAPKRSSCSKNPESQSQIQNADGSINNLPPEILVQILGNLDAPTLFACRLVSRQFNSISTEILWSRPEVELEFRNDKEEQLMVLKRGENSKHKKSLLHFVKCVKQSENCPFVRFSFDFSNSSLSELDYFLSQFDLRKIKCLKVSFALWFNASSSSVFDLAERVCDLLLNKIPHLEEFGLEMPFGSKAEELDLFSSSNSIQLAHLKVVHFGSDMFSNYPKIVRDLVGAAVNLEKILPFPRHSLELNVSDFCYFHSLGKLDWAQHVSISLSHKFISEMKEQLPNLANLLKLSKLELRSSRELQRAPQSWPDAAVFLSALFHSSKNTLESLEMEPLGFLPNLQWPRFTKLEKLILYHSFNDDVEMYSIFPPGVKSPDIFPAVRDLELFIKDWHIAFPEENSIPRIPNVQRIDLTDLGELYNQIELLPSICPSVKHLEIFRMFANIVELPCLNFLQVGRTVATHLPKLESLELCIDMDSPENNSHAFDSCFTGFSEENCKRLFKSAPKQRSSWARNIMSWSKFKLDSDLIPEREHPSIFDMKNLKKLTVNPRFGGRPAARKFFMEKLTWISKKYTLELMPQLKLTGAENQEN